MKNHIIVDQNTLEDLACNLAQSSFSKSGVVYLEGEIGSGKTFFTKSFIKSCGFQGNVLSPTYSILETYQINHNLSIIHMDLYRISDPYELDFVGIEEFSIENSLFFIEWPKKGLGSISAPNVTLKFDYYQNKRKLSYECDARFKQWIQVFSRYENII